MSSKVWRATVPVTEEVRGWGENKRTLPALHARVEVTIKLEALISSLARKAVRSKALRSSALGGMVKLKVLSAKEIIK